MSNPSRVLVVDDDADTRKVVSDFVQKQLESSAIQVANNGKEALMKIKNESFDFIITDIRMPEIDGMGLLAELKMKFPDAKPKILVLSGCLPNDLEGKQVGATLFLAKPLNHDRIKQWLEAA